MHVTGAQLGPGLSTLNRSFGPVGGVRTLIRVIRNHRTRDLADLIQFVSTKSRHSL